MSTISSDDIRESLDEMGESLREENNKLAEMENMRDRASRMGMSDSATALDRDIAQQRDKISKIKEQGDKYESALRNMSLFGK